MFKNVIIRKLDGTFQDNTLPRLGKMVIGSIMTGNDHFYMKFAESTTLRCLNGIFTSTGTNEKTFTAGATCYSQNEIQLNNPSETIADIEIPKYSSAWIYNRFISGISDDRSIDMSFLEYIEETSDISFVGSKTNLAVIKNFKLEYFTHLALGKYADPTKTSIEIRACRFDVQFDITNMYRYLPESTIIVNLIDSTNIIGTLDNLGSCVKVVDIFPPNSKLVYLDILNFVANARNAGQTTGSVNIHYPYLITLIANGNVITPITQENGVIEWTPGSITFQGNPIN